MNAVKTIYRTQEEWKERAHLSEYQPNQEITGEFDEKLAVQCVNGTFVGKLEEEVKVWRGIPYATQPVGQKRFEKATAPEPSDKVFEAYHFGKTCLQPRDDSEMASLYQQGEDCLNLNIWNKEGELGDKKKPVFVYIHGGGWMYGGGADPLYDGHNLAYYNPEILVITITYRTGVMGQVNLENLEGGEDYYFALNNGVLDQVQALKWIKENIAGFGGDPENITVCGESAGGGSVSALCVMKEAKGLFQKAIPMSGSVDQANRLENTEALAQALKDDLGCKTMVDIKSLPFETIAQWWRTHGIVLLHHCVQDGRIIEQEPFECWRRGMTKDLIILQGHTANEFAYYLPVFQWDEPMFDAICELKTAWVLDNHDERFQVIAQEYIKALDDLGYTDDKEKDRQFINDCFLAFGNTYQAILHAQNGGQGYSYTFEKSYDGSYERLGAAHAIDCFYLFGNFNGQNALGTDDEVDLSRKFQRMIANFCTSGNPSIEGLEWPLYDGKTRQKMMIGDNLRVEQNPEKDRIDAALDLIEISPEFRYTGSLSMTITTIMKERPEIFEEFMKKAQEAQEKLS